MTIQTIGVIAFLIMMLYILLVPECKLNLYVVVIGIGVVMLCIGGIVLSVLFFVVIGALYAVTKL